MRFHAAAAAFAASAAFAACAQQGMRVEFTSVPSGATVTVDGSTCGLSPTTSYLQTGVKYHVNFTLDGYEPLDAIFSPDSYSKVCHGDLSPVKGLLLVTSEPAGAEITQDGYPLGETPRLVTTLNAKDVHYLVLHKNGYLDRKLEIKFNGRKPLVQNVKLQVDSGSVGINTDPQGAEAILNGVSRGWTPVKVDGVPKGRISLILKKKGYADVVRDISVSAGETENVFVALEELPGSLRLLSNPEGARFYVDGRAEGRGPLLVEKIKSGSHTIRAELDGFAPMERTVAVKRGELSTEEFALSNILGRVEIITVPSGASIYLDGKPAGVTKSDSPSQEKSDMLTIPDVKEGEHTLAVKRKGYAEATRNIKVEAGKPFQLTVKLREVFTPDIRVVTDAGTVEGVLERSDDKMLFIRLKEGTVYPVVREHIRGKPQLLEENK